MQKQFQIVVTGQEVEQDDLNQLGAEAALSEDRVLSELVRLQPFDGLVLRGILPYGTSRQSSSQQYLGVVAPSGAADASIFVPSFRALIGTRTDASTSIDKFLVGDFRAVHMSTNGFGVQLAATVSNHRWDLVYARVDVDVNASAVSRYVKNADGTEGVQSVSIYKQTTITIGVVRGTEGATPALPAIPADSSTAFYIPLSYVALRHPFTLTTPVLPGAINEGVAPIVGVAPAVGGLDAGPANGMFTAGLALPTWTPATGRPREYLAPSNGKVERVFGLDFTGGNQSLVLGGYTVLDNSVDWRKRIFKTTVQGRATGNLAWAGSGAATMPGADTGVNGNLYSFMGQSLIDDFGSLTHSHGHVALLNHVTAPVMALTSQIDIFVDGTTGNLMAFMAPTTPDCLLFVWIESLSPFSNAS